jgi:hypothetical protein
MGDGWRCPFTARITREEFAKLFEEMRRRMPRKPEAKPADGEKEPAEGEKKPEPAKPAADKKEK